MYRDLHKHSFKEEFQFVSFHAFYAERFWEASRETQMEGKIEKLKMQSIYM